MTHALLAIALILVAARPNAQAQPPDNSTAVRTRTERLKRQPRPVILTVGTARTSSTVRAGATLFTVRNLGAPAPAAYVLGAPIAFNNAGQVVGVAYNVTRGNKADCLLYTAPGAFTDLTPGADYNCKPESISNASAGTLYVTGNYRTPFDDSPIAFAAKLSATTAPVVSSFNGNVASNLYGVNVTGAAVGTATYAPYTGFFTSAPPFVAPVFGKGMTVLQPACTTGVAGCASPDAWNTYDGCPFGGCFINDAGVILAYDPAATPASILTYTSANATPVAHVPTSGTAMYYEVAINNANQIVYDAFDATYSHISSYAYTGGTAGTTVQLPKLAGNSCAYNLAISLNNTGTVLGYTDACAVASDHVYWTWNAANGIQNLNSRIPLTGYQAIEPIGINDAGQILAALTTTSGTAGWGLLVPPVPPATRISR